MRSEKELFELMLEHKDFFSTGICDWIFELWITDLITLEEYSLITYYLDTYQVLNLSDCLYWFPKGEIEPRIEWIKQQIEKLSKDEKL